MTDERECINDEEIRSNKEKSEVDRYSLVPRSFRDRREVGDYFMTTDTRFSNICQYESYQEKERLTERDMVTLKYRDYSEYKNHGKDLNELNMFNINVVRRTMVRRKFINIMISKICGQSIHPNMCSIWLENIIMTYMGCGFDTFVFFGKYMR